MTVLRTAVRAKSQNISPVSHPYNRYKDERLDAVALEAKVKALMMDHDVTNKKGIYAYVLSGDERDLNIRRSVQVRNGKRSRDRTAYVPNV